MTLAPRTSTVAPQPCEVFFWNPERPRFGGRIGQRLPFTVRPNNFGDLLGPLVVEALARAQGRDPQRPVGSWQLLSVGSVMHFARDGAVVWGSGINAKMPAELMTFRELDVRAVRGPRTARTLRERGIRVPDVFGDPGLLMGRLFPGLQTTGPADRLHRVAFVPNLNDRSRRVRLDPRDVQVDPRGRLLDVLRVLANSELVVGSSLHALIVAESFGVPARMIRPEHESDVKYAEYYESTGRATFTPAATPDQAVAMGGEPAPRWDPRPLLDAFPRELWAPAAQPAASTDRS